MQRVRRLASIAVIAVLGTTALSACRSDSSVAAYLGDRKITEAEVTSVLEDATSRVPSPSGEAAAGGAVVRVPSRSEVVRVLVLGDVCRRLTAERGLQPSERANPDQVAAQFALPAGSRYVQQLAELYTCLTAIPADQQVTPTDADLTDLVARGRRAGVVSPDERDADARNRLSQGPQLGTALSQRKVLSEALDRDEIIVSPRYRPLEFPLLSFSDGSPAVSVLIGQAGPDMLVEAR
ncbi:hypothetical protein [Micromonospora sp. HM5-17]|jgi:hypothetical protein|uniref:hypothetical protein n=1 Tax=Micromonospora sp. HM5-17 TaxID=2487710 RepID=UPI001F317475|nr:hypothetical protein [Micromonospora sp. HM5-17]